MNKPQKISQVICNLGGIILFGLIFMSLGIRPVSSASELSPKSASLLVKSIHPPIFLLDSNGQQVIDTGQPISTRASCGHCHDYDLISQGLHSQQGRLEILAGKNKVRPFPNLVSPGMYGKWCCLPNRQLTPITNRSKEGFDFGSPDWLRSCGTCHVGGGLAEFDRLGRRYDQTDRDSLAELDPDYHLYSQKYDKVIPWDWQESGVAEVDCFLCHLPDFNRLARDAQIREGYFSWALTATLLGTGIVQEEMGELSYNPEAFNPDKTVKPELLSLGEPEVDNCGQCHGLAKTGAKAGCLNPFFSNELLRGTKKMARVWSSAKIKDSDLNLQGKENLDFAWDIHAQKKMKCIDCHFSPNNPAKAKAIVTTRATKTDTAMGTAFKSVPVTGLTSDSGVRMAKDFKSAPVTAYPLLYHPPTLKWRDFLLQPDHNLAKGDGYPQTVADNLDGSMRGCADCHLASASHDWLPYRNLHFQKIACETCHIPKKYYWACQQIDLTIFPQGISNYRGVIGDYKNLQSQVVGFQPAYFLKRSQNSLEAKIIPCNPIGALFWFDQQHQRPAFPHQVRQAFYQWDEKFQLKMLPLVVKFFDLDQDGQVSEKEMRLDSLKKINFAKALLGQQGLQDPQLTLEVIPFSLNHNILIKEQAIKDCRECHSAKSRWQARMEIFNYLPPGVNPTISEVVPRDLRGKQAASAQDGKIFYSSAFILENLYLMGFCRNIIVEWLGWLSVLISLIGSFIHGTLRILANHKRNNT